jgi:nicotinate-nucleotide--dimethylbenzimidazole phosphoribosyltransferase
MSSDQTPAIPDTDAELAWLAHPVAAIDHDSRAAARARQQQLTKPPGSLGRLETLAVDFAGWQGTPLPTLEHCLLRVFAADHGIVAEGVSAFPQAVTVEMIRNFAAGGAAISVLARRHGLDLRVVNLGTATALPAALREHPAIQDYQLAPGSGNISTTRAMDRGLLAAAMAAGAAQVAAGPEAQLFIGGEMGIGNTATSAALLCALLQWPVAAVVGRGSGVDDAGLGRKRDAVQRALELHLPHCHTPLDILGRLGGLEIAALAGAYLAAAQRGIPSLVDGFICSTAALLASRCNPGVSDWLLFSHCSAEACHRDLLLALQARPLLDLELRLGEGSGAALVLPLLRDACALHAEMATFAAAGVSGAEAGA